MLSPRRGGASTRPVSAGLDPTHSDHVRQREREPDRPREQSDGGDRSYLDEEPDYDGWLDWANNYEQTVDWTDEDAVTVLVGYD
ncbi:MAG: hypothetical protein ACOC06_07440, partial [Halorubrum sp.]